MARREIPGFDQLLTSATRGVVPASEPTPPETPDERRARFARQRQGFIDNLDRTALGVLANDLRLKTREATDLYSPDADELPQAIAALTKAMDAGRGRFAVPYVGAVGGPIAEIERARARDIEAIGSLFRLSQSAVQAPEMVGLTDIYRENVLGEKVKVLSGQFPTLFQDMLAEVNQEAAALREALPRQLEQVGVALGMGLVEATRDAAPSVAVRYTQMVQEGLLDYVAAVNASLNDAEAGAIKNIREAMSFRELRTVDAAALDARLREAELTARHGRNRRASESGSGFGSSAEEIMSLRPLSEREALRGQDDIVQADQRRALERMGVARSKLAEARATGDATQIRQALADMDTAQDDLAGTAARLREIRTQIEELTGSWAQLGIAARESLETTLGEGLDDLIWKTGSLRDALLSFAHDITSAFTQMASKRLLINLIGDWGTPNASGGTNPMRGLFGALAGGLGNLFKGAPKIPAPNLTLDALPGAANGAVWPGFTPIKAFADGGLVTRPTIGIVGERADRKPEAIVPLPNGRAIPVEMRGGGQGAARAEKPQVNLVLVASPEEMTRKGLAANADMIVDMVNGRITHGHELRKSLRRRTGMG